MAYYLDADIVLALIKPADHLKNAAIGWIERNRNNGLVTSSMTAMELWFYLYRNGAQDQALAAVRSLSKICEVQEVNLEDIEAALLISDKHGLSPADAIHAHLASNHEGIVSSDRSYDKITGLNRIDFSKR